MMLFGEKYPEVVRMVSVGEFSKELCGGTHVNNTGEIGMFRITRESSVSSGVRRIEAVTGHEALARARASEAAITEVAQLLRTSTADVPKRVTALVNEVRDLKKAVSSGAKAGVSLDKLLAEATDVKGTTVVIADASGVEAQGLREMIDTIRKKTKSSAILLAAGEEGKVTIVCGISRDLQERKLSAGEWIKAPAEAVGGRGGGRPDMAQAGGKNVAALADALKVAKDSIEKMLSA
jgi:alanyl-tRNA synthetase